MLDLLSLAYYGCVPIRRLPDGQHFVMIEKDPLELRPLDLVIVPGWVEEMKARLAAAK